MMMDQGGSGLEVGTIRLDDATLAWEIMEINPEKEPKNKKDKGGKKKVRYVIPKIKLRPTFM